MKLEQNHASALLYVNIKQSSLAVFCRGLKFIYLFCRGVKQGCVPPIHNGFLKNCDKIDNLDQKFCLMAFSERKNQNFQSKEKINITAYYSAQAILITSASFRYKTSFQFPTSQLKQLTSQLNLFGKKYSSVTI